MLEIPQKIYDEIELMMEIPVDSHNKIVEKVTNISNEIKSEIDSFSSQYCPEDLAHLFYLLGYTLYHNPEKLNNPFIYREIEKSLSSAIEIDSEHYMAQLYLGYNAYDRKDFLLAKERFRLINENDLEPFFALKLLEIKLCCSIRVDGLGSSFQEFEDFLDEADRHPVEDVFPLSLDRTIEDCRNSLRISQEQQLEHLLKRLNASWYSRRRSSF
ncbi:MAG: hypothetical protein F6J87_31255 [Spirulina sp. SIO3F2]|nr:hypothetical protein [Spirulina sp. SIO3F2]